MSDAKTSGWGGTAPTTTVVIASYHHEQYVVEALDSVAAQTLRPTQLIVTDDASTDRSQAEITAWTQRRWPRAVLSFSQENLGLPATLNRVRSLLTGEFVVIMSADDRMREDRIERQVEAIVGAGPAVGMCYSDAEEIDEGGAMLGHRWFDADRRRAAPGSGDLFAAMVHRPFIPAPTVMFRRAVLEAAGTYDEQLVAEDYDMFLRMSRLAEWVFVDAPLVFRRVSSASLSASEAYSNDRLASSVHVLRKHLGVSPETDYDIARHTSFAAERRYRNGLAADVAQSELRAAFEQRRILRLRLLRLAANLRIPGRVVDAALRVAR